MRPFALGSVREENGHRVVTPVSPKDLDANCPATKVAGLVGCTDIEVDLPPADRSPCISHYVYSGVAESTRHTDYCADRENSWVGGHNSALRFDAAGGGTALGISGRAHRHLSRSDANSEHGEQE